MYLDVHFSVQDGVFIISQSSYTEKCLHHFGLGQCQTFFTSMVTNFFDEAQQHTDYPIIASGNYRNLIGCPQFLAQRSRPNIMLSVNILAQYSARPTKYLSNCIKRIFDYL